MYYPQQAQPQMNMGMNQNFNPYGQISNPYMDRMNQLQQYQQNLQMAPVQMSGTPQQQYQQAPTGISTRIVDDFNSLSANDVPMDGNGAIFIKRDGSEIQWRNWAANGTIVTTPYKQFLEQSNQEGTNIPQMDFNGLYEDVKALRGEISERFDRLEKSMVNPAAKSSGSRNKKEASTDE